MTDRVDRASGKPSAEPVAELCRRMGVAPQDCLLVEDSASGVASGVAAGVPTLWVGPAVRGDRYVCCACVGCARPSPPAVRDSRPAV